MKLSILSLYPDAIKGFLNRGVIGRAITDRVIDVTATDLRTFADPPHHKVDDYPFSNRKGMLLRSDILKRGIDAVASQAPITWIMPDPAGLSFDYKIAKSLSSSSHLGFISPAYEGVDARIFDMVDIHRYRTCDVVVPNGDTPIMLMIEAIVRYLPGVLGSSDCIEDDSILSGLLEAPQFCAPRSIDQMGVPEVLLSGHHQEIGAWKLKQSLRRTLYARPDLINEFSFSKTLVNIIDQIITEDTQ